MAETDELERVFLNGVLRAARDMGWAGAHAFTPADGVVIILDKSGGVICFDELRWATREGALHHVVDGFRVGVIRYSGLENPITLFKHAKGELTPRKVGWHEPPKPLQF